MKKVRRQFFLSFSRTKSLHFSNTHIYCSLFSFLGYLLPFCRDIKLLIIRTLLRVDENSSDSYIGRDDFFLSFSGS